MKPTVIIPNETAIPAYIITYERAAETKISKLPRVHQASRQEVINALGDYFLFSIEKIKEARKTNEKLLTHH